ncbi:glycosyltransferase [Fictibacillus sp. WQ 8-8]|uniref:glycosyltransferase n=1 Tax=unclassified Fictibacillus TaxID=2644029 RepID=UPI00210ADFE7|nr:MULTISPECIES: glycosyltransferase [unclassified Fictibacillus]MCQ6265563.1 glycosyltransferase [Fictibacillus sp. WQ 8-8]MED2973534.1 glycosyltransferase [Fictibacillus sp. B-59209]
MLVSVVMAVYNAEDYVEEAIKSILNQTYDQIELIIVNDASIDRSYEILESIKDQKVKVIHLDKNQGAAHCLNIGIKQASGSWIAIQDADDLSLPNRIEEQVKYVTNHAGIAAVGSFIHCIHGKELISNELLLMEEEGYNASSEHLKEHRFFSCFMCHGSVMFSKSVFDKLGGYNPAYRIAYDYDLWMRMLEILPIHKLPKVLYEYRIHPDSLSRLKRQDTVNEVWLISSKNIQKKLVDGLNHNPNFVIIGDRKTCKEFKNIACTENSLSVYDFYYKNNRSLSSKIYKLYCTGKVDAVIFLNSYKLLGIYEQLKQQGLIFNDNLFRIMV